MPHCCACGAPTPIITLHTRAGAFHVPETHCLCDACWRRVPGWLRALVKTDARSFAALPSLGSFVPLMQAWELAIAEARERHLARVERRAA